MKHCLIFAAVIAVALLCAVGSPVHSSSYGIVDHWLGDYGNNPMDIIMDNLGAGWIRCAFDWDEIEVADDQYDWFLQDRMIDAMTAIGVNCFINVGYTPAWARSGGTRATPPSNPAKYTEFITVQVNRYKDRVKYWGFWNEPNLTQFYTGDFNWYINNLLIPGINAVKAADPTAKTVVGELSTSGDDVGKLRTILRAIVAAGVKDKVDVICHHSYDGGDTAAGRLADMDTLRNMIVAEGFGDKEFWCTEIGWQSSQGGEANQANQIIAYMTGMDARPWFNKTFYYTLTEGAAGGFGLIRPDWSLKPAYTQYQAYISQHADDAEMVSNTIPTTMNPGQAYAVSVTVKNTGSVNWDNQSVWKLGAVGDYDPFANARQQLNPGEVIAPNQTKTFNFTMTAPTAPATYTTDWQMVHEGVRWFGQQLVKQVTVGSGGGQTPYSGVIALPGTIQAENFDNGGQNVAYYDTSGGNAGGAYRSTDVDIEGCADSGGGYNVGWVEAGEWLEYTVNVASSGDYSIKMRVASPSGGDFRVQLDGANVFSTRSFASTGGWQNWTTIIVPARYMAAGQHILRVCMDTGGWNLNKIDVVSHGADAVSIDLGPTDITDGITHISAGDGDTCPWTLGGHYCRANWDVDDNYMYFNVTEAYAYQGSSPNIYITFDYYDRGSGSFGLNYDAIGNVWAYVAGPAITNTNTWKTYTFHVTNAYFGNRENYGADFRICGPGGGQEFEIDTVTVSRQ